MMLTSCGGAATRVGRELARGGEGIIYELPDRPDRVLKLYSAPPTPELAAKLRAIVRMPASRLPAEGAWPSDLIEKGSNVIGMIMPRVQGRHDLYKLLSGADRRSLFPRADYRMLVASAANLARAVAAVHAAGHVIGDVNERCAMVGTDATVTLVDCDSYQIEAAGSLYTCDVGTPMYQPPEMQQVGTFRGRTRTRNHDAFGLAVLIFQLLFFGRHPFAGRPVSGEAPELPEAIRTFQFAWRAGSRLQQPPNALSLAQVGAMAEAYFQRAFGEDALELGRPRAAAWATALDAFQAVLQRCRVNPAHWHLPGRCPICTIEGAAGVNFFLIQSAPASAYNPEHEARALWAAIEADPLPPPRQTGPTPDSFRGAITATPYPRVQARGWAGGLVQSLGLLSKPSNRDERAKRETQFVAARRRYNALAEAWRNHDATYAFKRRRAELAVTRHQLATLFTRRHEAIAAAQHQAGLRHFLGAYGIAQAGISGLGRGLIGTLTAHGVTTAADISIANLTAIPGIGPKRRAALLTWHDGLVRVYRSKGTGGVLDTAMIRHINAQYESSLIPLLATLRNGVGSLRALADRERLEASTKLEELRAAARAVAQAEADLDAPTMT